jgi:hypothetical protein
LVITPDVGRKTLFLAVVVLALSGCGHSSETRGTTATETLTTSTTTPTSTGGGTTSATTTTAGGARTVPNANERRLVVGAVEDEAKFAPTDDAARADMTRAHAAGFRAIALSAFWQPPLTRLRPIDRDALSRAARAAVASSITPIVDVAQLGGDTPLTPAQQEQFASFAASVPRLVPEIEYVVVGNEPNTNLFWRPQFDASGGDAAATAYESLLARSYDAIKAVSPKVEVIGGGLAPRGADRPHGKRPTHSPVAFISDLGAAYRASGRKLPLMDAFSMHPYGSTPREPPTLAHPGSTSIGIADYDRLVRLLRDSLGRSTPIVYGEYGVNTTVPPDVRASYTGTEVASKQPVDAQTQARYYAEAIKLAACQPLVQMLLFFHVTDEPQLEHFQTGMYYANRTPKPGLAEVAQAAGAAGAGAVPCPR